MAFNYWTNVIINQRKKIIYDDPNWFAALGAESYSGVVSFEDQTTIWNGHKNVAIPTLKIGAIPCVLRFTADTFPSDIQEIYLKFHQVVTVGSQQIAKYAIIDKDDGDTRLNPDAIKMSCINGYFQATLPAGGNYLLNGWEIVIIGSEFDPTTSYRYQNPSNQKATTPCFKQYTNESRTDSDSQDLTENGEYTPIISGNTTYIPYKFNDFVIKGKPFSKLVQLNSSTPIWKKYVLSQGNNKTNNYLINTQGGGTLGEVEINKPILVYNGFDNLYSLFEIKKITTDNGEGLQIKYWDDNTKKEYTNVFPVDEKTIIHILRRKTVSDVENQFDNIEIDDINNWPNFPSPNSWITTKVSLISSIEDKVAWKIIGPANTTLLQNPINAITVVIPKPIVEYTSLEISNQEIDDWLSNYRTRPIYSTNNPLQSYLKNVKRNEEIYITSGAAGKATPINDVYKNYRNNSIFCFPSDYNNEHNPLERVDHNACIGKIQSGILAYWNPYRIYFNGWPSDEIYVSNFYVTLSYNIPTLRGTIEKLVSNDKFEVKQIQTNINYGSDIISNPIIEIKQNLTRYRGVLPDYINLLGGLQSPSNLIKTSPNAKTTAGSIPIKQSTSSSVQYYTDVDLYNQSDTSTSYAGVRFRLSRESSLNNESAYAIFIEYKA